MTSDNHDHDPTSARLHDSVIETLAAYGTTSEGVRVAHEGERNPVGGAGRKRPTRAERESQLGALLAENATRPSGAGERAIDEEPDDWRTCFEKDRDRIKYAPAFRRLSGKCQVFVAPRNDMLRTRLTHSIEVSQVGVSVANATGLNVPLVEAMTLGHDCGHGPGGHAAEEAFSPFVPGGFDHAVWGADVALVTLNLTRQTLDGIRNHSWKRPAPATPEASVCSWADRIAYVCHDFADAVRAGVVSVDELPEIVARRAGTMQARQLGFFIDALIEGTNSSGIVGMEPEAAEVLDAFRRFNYERIYLRPASMVQAHRVIRALTGLVESFTDAPADIPELSVLPTAGSPDAALCAVRYVATMTDRYAFGLAVERLGFRPEDLPLSV